MNEETELNLCKDCIYFKPKGVIGFCKVKTKLVKKDYYCEEYSSENFEEKIKEQPKQYNRILIKDGKKYFL